MTRHRSIRSLTIGQPALVNLLASWSKILDGEIESSVLGNLSRAGLEPATHWLKASCSTD